MNARTKALLVLKTLLTSGAGAAVASSLTVKLLILYWGTFSALSPLLYFYCRRNFEAPKAASLTYLSPAFAAILSFLILGEPITGALARG